MKGNRIALLVFLAARIGFAQSTTFTYQGRLMDGANAATGTYDLQFTIYDALSAGSAVAGPVTNSAVSVSNGLFNVSLDFGPAVFSGGARWLEIAARAGGSGAFSTLSPRQQISSAPYAVRAAQFGGPISDAQLSANIARLDGNEAFSGTVSFTGASNQFAGSFVGNGAGVTNVPGALPTQTLLGSSVQATANTSYEAASSAPVTVTLPANASVSDIVRVDGVGSGGWQVLPGSGQIINGYQAGAVWVPRENYRYWTSVACSGDGSRMVAAEANGRLYVSTDGGATWIVRDSTRNWRAVGASANGLRLVAAELSGLLYSSTDGGTNWIARDSARSWIALASSSDGMRLLAAEYSGQLYTSSNGGTNWVPRDANRTWTSVASSADGSKLAATDYNGGAGGLIYTSSDGGTNWVPRGTSHVWQGIASSADGSKLVAVESIGQIWVSTDSGTNWTAHESSRDWRAVASSADGSRLVAVAAGAQVYVSRDSGITWTPAENNRGWDAVASSAAGTRLLASVNNGQLFTSVEMSAAGTQGSSLELRYAGNGIWQPVDNPNTTGSGAGTTFNGNVAVVGGNLTVTGGSVGIGTTTPGGALQVASGGVAVTGASAYPRSVGPGIIVEEGNGYGHLYAYDWSALAPNPLVLNLYGGNVGIGLITTPATTLQVAGTFSVTGGKASIGGTNAHHQLSISGGPTWTSAGWKGALEFETGGAIAWNADAGGQRFGIGQSGGGLYFLRTASDPGSASSPATYDMLITDAGNVGIGTTFPSAKLSVAGTANNSTGVWGVFSDRRLKDHIMPMSPGSLDHLLRLEGVTFEYNRPELATGYSGTRRGWLAQDVEKVFPEWVSEAPNGMKMVTPVGFDALAVEAMRELRQEKDAQIADLKARVEKLEQLLKAKADRE